MRVRFWNLIAIGVAASFLSGAGIAQAQIDDHLKCYKIRDSLSLKGKVDLRTPQFGLEPGCKISSAQLFCVPATKTVLKANVDPLLPIFGPPAPGDRICYKVVCPPPFPPDTQVTDQFGTRQLTMLKPRLLCTPAFKDQPPAPCELSGFPTCDGECPDPTEDCEPANDGTARCVCKTPCGRQADGSCGGDCAVATDLCQLNSAGECDCGPAAQACADAVAPQCAGDCPIPGTVCEPILGTTLCDCVDQAPCGPDAAGMCAGICAVAGETCQFDPTGCTCLP